MPCVTSSADNVFFVRWEKPEVDDMRIIVREMIARRREVGRRLIYVALAPETSDTPSAEARKEMPSLMNQALLHCEEMHLVMEGVGFKHSVMRSVMAAVFLAGGRRDRVHVHARVEDVVRKNPGPELRAALQTFAARGLLTDLPAMPRAMPPARRLPIG